MISIAIIALIVVAGIGDAAVQRHAAHSGVEAWRTD